MGSISWGGAQGDRVMFEVKGENTPGAVKALRGAYEHRVTRVDACADFDAPGAFEALLAPCIEIRRNTSCGVRRRATGKISPSSGEPCISVPQLLRSKLGCTKGKQPEYLHLGKPDWCRLELQVRPAKEAKRLLPRFRLLRSGVLPSGQGRWLQRSSTNISAHTQQAPPTGFQSGIRP